MLIEDHIMAINTVKGFFTVSSGFNAYLEVFSGENKMQS